MTRTAIVQGRRPTDREWGAILRRDASLDGAWVFAVRTTGIFCRPSCPSRRPHRANVELLGTAAAARAAGYRPCKRCEPEAASRVEPGRDLAERAARTLAKDGAGEITVEELAARLGCSASHLQRVFAGVWGVTPRGFLRAARRRRSQALLRSGSTVRDATFRAGHRSSGRLYEDRNDLGMTPGAYRSGARHEAISYAFGRSPLGLVVVGSTPRGVCAVRFGEQPQALLEELRTEFPHAELTEDDAALSGALEEILGRIGGRAPHRELPLDLRATAFQQRVWDELRRIPPGATTSYARLAASLGTPAAGRAVAKACATNPAAIVVPCHRVVGKDGALRGYRWGLARKRALLQAERDQAEAANE